jgi:hypothetical protein
MRGKRRREQFEKQEAQKQAEAAVKREQRAFRAAIVEIADGLGEQEPRQRLFIERAASQLGLAYVQGLYAEVQGIEAQGGMMTADGSRRRTPGGVFMLLLKQHLNETGQKAALKAIMG